MAAFPEEKAESAIEVERSAAGTFKAGRKFFCMNCIPFTESAELIFVSVVSVPEGPNKRFPLAVVKMIV